MPLHRTKDFSARWGASRGNANRLLWYCVLALGLAAMTAMTLPKLSPDLRTGLSVTLWCCLGYFAGELAVKAWARHNSGTASNYLFSSAGLIDVLAVLPIPLALLAGVPTTTAWLLASLWMLKLAAVTPGLSLLQRVIALEAKPLVSVLFIFLIVLMLSSAALYLLEGADQPQSFGSLPSSLWWAVATLTGTGYGDAIPQTFLGRVIAGLVMICGLGVFGLWTGILATGFAAEYRRRAFVSNWDLVTRVPFLRNLDPPTIIQLTHMLRRVDLAERIVVVRQGRPGDCMYFVASGEVEVMIEPQSIRLGPGTFFGEIALLEGGPRTATVVTTVPTTLLSLEISDFRTLAADDPDLAQAVAAEGARRARETAASPPATPSSAPTENRFDI